MLRRDRGARQAMRAHLSATGRQTPRVGASAGSRPVATPASLLPGRRLGQVPALDGLRGIAILAVAAFHFSLAFWPNAQGVAHLPGGFLGVDMFFVLSGS